jgi:hypothetical protein
LKYFLGGNVNAIEIQVWVTLIAWLLIEVIHHGTKRKWSFSNMITACESFWTATLGYTTFWMTQTFSGRELSVSDCDERNSYKTASSQKWRGRKWKIKEQSPV